MSKSGEDGVEVVKTGVFDDDFALALLVFDGDFEAEGAAELILGFADVGVLGDDGLGVGLGAGFGVEEALDVVFGAADGEVEGEDLLRGGGDGFGGFEGEESAGVAEGDVAGLDVLLDGCRELEEAEEVGDAGAVFAGARGHLLLGEVEVLGEALVGAGLLHGVEVGALEVFDDGHLHRLAVGDFADDGRDGRFAGALRGEPAALAGDELVTASGDGTDHDGLDDSRGRDGGGEFGELGFVELRAGLERVAVDLADGDFERLAGRGFGRGRRRRWARRGARAGATRGLCRVRGVWDRCGVVSLLVPTRIWRIWTY